MADYPLFTVMGIEIEYMLVDKDTLDVVPLSDVILQHLAGDTVNEVALGEISASNELVMHVLELKNTKPATPEAPVAAHFMDALNTLKPILDSLNVQCLPTGAHPWMNPSLETQRWPHQGCEIYHQYDQIFNCKGHGWSNLQSMHVNLPFATDTEFSQLHNAIRLLLPLLPALAASTPFLDGRVTGLLDTRLDFYGKNQKRLPSISGDIIPGFVESEKAYQESILQPMYKEIHPYDPEGILQFEWLNSRAAIPKFECKAIEIRILDTQECVNSDIAIAKAVFAVLKYWQEHSHYYLDRPCETTRLRNLYQQTLKNGLSVAVDDKELCRQWQLSKPVKNCRDALYLLIEKISGDLEHTSQLALEYILMQGNLSERLLRAAGNDHSRDTLKRIYRQLGHCLMHNQVFNPS